VIQPRASGAAPALEEVHLTSSASAASRGWRDAAAGTEV
jgi:hypothetical protein